MKRFIIVESNKKTGDLTTGWGTVNTADSMSRPSGERAPCTVGSAMKSSKIRFNDGHLVYSGAPMGVLGWPLFVDSRFVIGRKRLQKIADNPRIARLLRWWFSP